MVVWQFICALRIFGRKFVHYVPFFTPIVVAEHLNTCYSLTPQEQVFMMSYVWALFRAARGQKRERWSRWNLSRPMALPEPGALCLLVVALCDNVWLSCGLV